MDAVIKFIKTDNNMDAEILQLSWVFLKYCYSVILLFWLGLETVELYKYIQKSMEALDVMENINIRSMHIMHQRINHVSTVSLCTKYEIWIGKNKSRTELVLKTMQSEFRF